MAIKARIPGTAGGTLGRREMLGAALVAATSASPAAAAPRTRAQPRRMPVAFVGHGGGPYPILPLGFPQDERTALLRHMRGLRQIPGATPKALLVISAHWEAPVPTVMTSAKPPLLYDYSGFPPEAYQLTWPAPGNTTLASRVRGLLTEAGFATAEDPQRGFDHGTFIPLKVAFPKAEIPAVQLSLIKGLDPDQHLRMGRALAPLREEGVFIIGSGNSFHNMGAFRAGMQGASVPEAQERARQFDAWLKTAVTAHPTVRDQRLQGWEQAPFGRYCHPREEHFIPLLVAAGAAGADRGVTTWSGSLAGLDIDLTLSCEQPTERSEGGVRQLQRHVRLARYSSKAESTRSRSDTIVSSSSANQCFSNGKGNTSVSPCLAMCRIARRKEVSETVGMNVEPT